MKRKSKRVQIIFAIVLVFSIPASSTYLFVDIQVEMDFLRSTLNFENYDQETVSWAEQPNLLTIFGSIFTVSLAEKSSNNPYSPFSFHGSSPVNQIYILRC